MKGAINQTLTTWSGFDTSKETFDAGLYLPLNANQPSREIKNILVKTFPRTREGLKLFHHWSYLERSKAGLEGGNMRIVMEATGRYSLELVRWLNEDMPFTKPAIEDSKTVSDFIKSLKLRNKTDKIDAAAIARYGAERQPAPFCELPEEYLYLRELIRQRSSLDKQLVAARQRLQEMTMFKDLINIQKTVVKSLEKAVEKLNLELKRHINKNEELCRDYEYAVSVPGVGEITAATILAECGPLEYFSSRQLGAFSGLAPGLRKSGKSIDYSRISRRGSGELKRVLYMASISAIGSNPRMNAFYHRLKRKGKKSMQARCAVMHKLLILVRAVVVNKTKYDKKYGLKA